MEDKNRSMNQTSDSNVNKSFASKEDLHMKNQRANQFNANINLSLAKEMGTIGQSSKLQTNSSRIPPFKEPPSPQNNSMILLDNDANRQQSNEYGMGQHHHIDSKATRMAYNQRINLEKSLRNSQNLNIETKYQPQTKNSYRVKVTDNWLDPDKDLGSPSRYNSQGVSNLLPGK